MRTKATTEGVNIIKVHVRPIDWTYGNVYGIRGQFTGELPVIALTYGDGRKGDDHISTTGISICRKNDMKTHHMAATAVSMNYVTLTRL